MNKDFIDVKNRKRTTKEKLRQELITEEAKYAKQFKPFCYRCARLDYDDLFENTLKEVQRKEGNVNADDLKVPKLNLNKYADKNKFKLISETEAWEQVRGTNKSELIGYHINYVCKDRGCGRSNFIPLDKYKELKGIKDTE